MFNLFKKKPKRVYTSRKKFEDEFLTMMNKMITQIEIKMEKKETGWDYLSVTGIVSSRDAEWLMLCRRFIDLINKIKKYKKSK
jgi:hypothetical protein